MQTVKFLEVAYLPEQFNIILQYCIIHKQGTVELLNYYCPNVLIYNCKLCNFILQINRLSILKEVQDAIPYRLTNYNDMNISSNLLAFHITGEVSQYTAEKLILHYCHQV